MKRIYTIILIAAAVLSVLGAGGYKIYKSRAAGGASPTIFFDKDEIELTTKATEEDLLQGVTARDDEDGDVSDSLMVERVSDLKDSSVTVTYVAFDSQNHVTRSSRTVHYTDYSSPYFTMSRPMVFMSSNVNSMMDGVGAKDILDGNISSAVRASYSDPTVLLSDPGIHDVELNVTNSVGDNVHITVPVRVTSDNPRSDQIPLSAYLVYLEPNAGFDPVSYLPADLAGAVQADASADLSVQIESNVNPSTSGVYAVDYNMLRNGQTTASTRLIVVVK